MPFLEFLFSPQAHKFRNGYYINHDTLMNGTSAFIQWALIQGTSLSFTSSHSNYHRSLAQKIVTLTNRKGNHKFNWQDEEDRYPKNSLDDNCAVGSLGIRSLV